jgi:hypothetical protein
MIVEFLIEVVESCICVSLCIVSFSCVSSRFVGL